MEVCGIAAKLLVDTGATLSDLHYIDGKDYRWLDLDKASRNVLDAGGNCLKLSGKGTFPAKIKAFSCYLEGVVAELGTDAIEFA